MGMYWFGLGDGVQCPGKKTERYTNFDPKKVEAGDSLKAGAWMRVNLDCFKKLEMFFCKNNFDYKIMKVSMNSKTKYFNI